MPSRVIISKLVTSPPVSSCAMPRSSSAATADGRVRAGDGVATLRIGPATPLRIVDVILTGVHEVGASHHELLRAFATDATLDKSGCRRLAMMAQDGLARSIRPVHTPQDGDTVFAIARLCAGRMVNHITAKFRRDAKTTLKMLSGVFFSP